MEVNMSNKKKIIIICSMVVLLIAVGYLNVWLNKSSDPVDNTNDPVTSVSFFEAYRMDRDTARAQEFSYLDAILTSQTSSEAAKASAEEMKLDLIDVMEIELVLEGLIKAKGFEDAVVTMSTNNVNVIVNDAELANDEVAQITYIITSETGYSPSNIVIVPYSSS
jgi:stage III sporulation protein AH